ncbi:putative Acyl-CoA transferase/carnitine dehydratase protein [Streptomyces himastatinicus ATCC 53653]|uniref:Putative Acyl-CoA transferase/carnitine dehydratase protein n=1 Tax=Streptomyces himastatinicus ATCC 53653 TaxID=457427 RepID=D9WP68_9ACTN|nr:CoA transferase [Streptomyces himastatinicus]EFL28041.1 putative Acyl-CoA transferase/carnitine dehydratase protein [Streptomyces himastatinicus ATCC 53653]
MSRERGSCPGPLAGVTVLELGTMYAAPTAGRMLRDFGARVIKVEDPGTGDFARHWTPQHNGLALGFARLNAGKESIGIDLRRPAGRDLVRRLAARVDVVLESFRPGRLEEWGLGYDVLAADNPGLVLTRVSGFGQTRSVPERERRSRIGVGQATRPPPPQLWLWTDSIAGLMGAFGTVTALLARSRTGRGDAVDVALYEPLMFILGDSILRYTSSGEIQQRVGNGSGSASPRGIYQAGDGHWMSIAASSQTIALRLFTAMGHPEFGDDPRFATNPARMEHNEELQRLVGAWVRQRPRAEVLADLEAHEVVAAPVNDARDIVEDPHFRTRTLVELAGTALGPVLVPGPVVHLDSYPGPLYEGVPAIGEHTGPALTELLGLTREELAELAASSAVAPDRTRVP